MDLGDGPPFPREWTCYFIQGGRAVIGFALIQSDVHAYLPPRPAHRTVCSVGVLRLWVLAKHRRQGVATTAMDAARHHGGHAIPKCMVAFSEPTEAGLAFATQYCGTELFVFDIDSA
jgi:predicted acetyltransferase